MVVGIVVQFRVIVDEWKGENLGDLILEVLHFIGHPSDSDDVDVDGTLPKGAINNEYPSSERQSERKKDCDALFSARVSASELLERRWA